MDLPSPTLSAKLSRTESTLYKDVPSHNLNDLNDSKDPMVQRCVIIQKDEKGYGLTVSGDNPVFVQSVKEDGAAARAGVQKGDRIIKVNGTLVTQSNHQEVVELIKSGSYVALTLLGKPPGQGKGSLSPQHSFNLSGNSAAIMNSNKSDSSERITGPQPVDPEKQQQLTNSRIHTIRKMLEKEMVYLENLKAEFSKTPSEKMRAEVNGAVKRVKTLEEQLCSLTGLQHEQIITRSPKSPTSVRHMHDRESYRSISFPAHGMHNRPLTHQISAPVLPANQATPPPSSVIPFTPSGDPKYQVILSPCTEDKSRSGKRSPEKKQSISTSLENIAKHLNPRSTTWPQPTHTRQSSSPETLRGLESLKCQKSNGCTKGDPLHRSQSSVSPPHGHFRSFVPSLDSKSNYPNASRVSSFSQHDSAIESPGPTPPSTPPEPVESNKSARNSYEGDESTHHEQHTSPTEILVEELNLPPITSKVSQNTNIICMEDDDFSDTEMPQLEDHGPFNGLWKLLRNPAHLSVFLHYLISNSDPSSLFFYLISDMYEQSTGREMKKWAYEIHSTFLVPGAPLKVSLVDETILHEIDEVLLNNIDKEEVLRTVFRKARKKAKEELNDFLADFRNKRTMGLASIFGPPDYQLEEAMQDKAKEQKIIEQLLGPCLENFSEDFEGVDDRTLAKNYALATVLKQFGIKNAQYLSILGKWPTFVCKEKSFITSLLQRNKKVMFMQGHNFVPEHYYCVTYCNHCQLIIWGVGYQGYQCQNCEMNIHKSCIKVVEEYCIGALRNKKEKTKDKEKTRKDRKSGIVENIIAKTRKPSQPVPAAIEKAKRLNEEMNADNGIIGADIHNLKDGVRGVDHLKEPSDIVFQNILNLSESADKPHSDLAEKKIEPPLKPRILHSLDTSNFCEEFTSQLPIYSPGKRPASGKIHVEGYSYIDPSLVFSKDVSVDGTFGMFPEQQALNLVSADNFSDSPFYKNYEIDYNKGELGRGAFSVCRVCIDQRTKLEYAVKIIDKKFDCSREIEFLQACQGHPNIVKLQEVLHDKDNTYIIMELLRGGELLDKIEEKIQFTEEEARKLFQQIVSAVNFMHEKNIVHRDLKPENLVFEDSSDDALIKIVDFGFARIKPSENEKMMSPCFTMKYAAPEVLNSTLSNSSNERGLADKPGYNEACDLWSLGVILHVMMSGSTPFSTNGKAINAEAAIQRIQEGEFSLTDELWDDVSEEAKDILQGLLTVDPERRLTMEQLCAKDWIRASWEDLEANNLQVATDASNSVSATTEESPMDFETPTREATTQDFCLRDVSASLLSQRQKRKRKSTDQNSSTFSNSDDIASSQTTNSSPHSLDMEVSHVSSNNESLMLGYNIDNCCYNQ